MFDEEAEFCAAMNRLAADAGQIAAATCAFLLKVADLDKAKSWDYETKSTANWMSARLGYDPRSAHEQVRVARRLGELPTIREAFAKGELSYDQVASLVRIATPELEGSLAQMARFATGGQLRRLVAAYTRVLNTQNAATENAARFRRSTTYYFDDDGFFNLSAKLTAEEGRVVHAALEAAAAEIALHAPVTRNDADNLESYPGTVDSSWNARRADALVAIAESALARGLTQRQGPDKTTLVIHVDETVLAGDAEQGGICEMECGPAISPEAAARHACDPSVIALVEDAQGNPMSVGRRSRKVSVAIRRAVQVRDQGCQFPGCGQIRFVDLHHITPWSQGGHTSLENIVQLCGFHHRHVHELGYRMEVTGSGTFRFFRPSGQEVPLPGLPGVTEPDQDSYFNLGDPRQLLGQYQGGRVRYDEALSCLFEHDSRIAKDRSIEWRTPGQLERATERAEAVDEEDDEEWLPVPPRPEPPESPLPAWLLRPPPEDPPRVDPPP